MRVVLKGKCRSLTGVVAVTILSLAAIFLFGGKTAIAAGNPELSFEGKIVNTAGTNITDGTYNMEFKMYTGCTNNLGAGCTAVWTEDWLVSGAGGSSPVTFTSGTFQVNLGSITAFGGSVPWDTSPLYLSLNIGNTSASCVPAGNFNSAVSCGADGVMSPYILLTSTPYAQDSAELGGLASTAFGQLASNQTWTGANTFQPTTNVSSLIAEQATGSPSADIFDVEGNGGAADEFINVTSTAANAGALTIKALGGTTTGNAITLLAGTAGSAANTGGAVSITAGTGSTSGPGGQASLQGGLGGTNGNGGIALIQGGTAGSTSGTGGEVEVIGGSGSTATGGGPGGELLLEGGSGTGTGANAGGAVQIQAGTASATGAPAAVTIQVVGETQVLTGSTTSPNDLIKTTTNSATAFQIQNSGNNSELTVDTSGNQVVLGKANTGGLNGTLEFLNNSNTNTATLQSGVTSSTYSLALPTAGVSGSSCLESTGGSTTAATALQFGACTGPKSVTKIVAMGTPSGCGGAAPVASSNPSGADFVVPGTSCTTADVTIQSAISALPAGGGVVYLEDGTYIISSSITIPSNVTLEGAGADTIIKLENSFSGTINMLSVSGSVSNVLIQDLKIDGNKANQSTGTDVGININTSGSPGATITNAWVQNMYGTINGDTGISLANSGLDTVTNTNVTGDSYDGIEDAAANSTISNTVSSSNSEYGFYTTGSYITLTGDQALSNTNFGFNIGGGNDNLTGSTSKSNSSYGIYLNASDIIASDNISTANTLDGIEEYGSNSTISGNDVFNNAGNGIDIPTGGGTGNVISGNTISESNAGTTYGVYVGNNNNSVIDNTIIGTGGSGNAIYIYSGAYNTYLSNNTYSGTGATSISDNGGDTEYGAQISANNDIVLQGAGAVDVGSSAQGTGTLSVTGGIVTNQLATPGWGIGGVSTVGGGSGTTWAYEITALDGTGQTLTSTQKTTSGPASLTGVNYNMVTFPIESGAVKYDIYRTTAPSTTGLVTTITAGTLSATNGTASRYSSGLIQWNDTGFTATTAVPVANTTGGVSTASDINTATELDLAGTPVCTVALSGCTPAAGSNNYVQVSPSSLQNGGDIDLEGDGSNPTATLVSNPSIAADTLDLVNGSSSAVLDSFSAHGSEFIKTNVAESDAFELQDQEGDDVLLANTGLSNMVKTSSVNTSGAVANWTQMGTITGGAPTGDTSNPLEGLASIEAVVGATATSGMKTAAFVSPMNPTTEYQLTFFAKCSISIATFSYGRQDVSGTTPGGDISNGTCNTNWQQYTLNFTTGGTTTSPNIFMNSGTSTSLDIWVDAVTLQQVSVNQANSYDPGDLYLNGTVVNPAIFENQANSTEAFQVQNSSNTDLLNVDTVNDVIQVGSQVTSSNSALLVLNSYNTYADPTTPSACGASTDLGGLYYNTASNTIRACINGGWQDLVSNQALGLLAFGVVSTSGTNPGDLNAVTTAQVTGPCKVSEGSSGVTDITVQPCTVYSGGREIVYAGITNVALSSFTNPLAASKYANLCFSNAAGTAPANTLQLLSSNTTPILAGLPTMTASAPIECIATLRADATANNLSTVYDTRTFTDSSKEFADAGVALGDGYIAITNGATEGVTDTATAVTAGIMGVVVASNGSTSTGAPNVIISTGGPAEVLNFTTIATLGDVVETGSVIGDAEAINAVGTAGAKNYEMLGIGENAAAAAQDTTACASVAACQGSIYTDVNIAF